MAITPKISYRGSDNSGNKVLGSKSVQILEDAVNSDEAVRLSQSESIADQAAQDILVSLSNEASNETAFTSASMVGFLGNKQDNLEIDASSTAYLQIVDGYKLKATQLLITDVEVNETCTNLQMFIDTYSPSKQEGDVIILTAATDNQQRSWIKTGSASQGVEGYTRLQTDYNVVSIRSMFSAAQYLSYDSASGQFGLVLGNLAGQLGAHTLPIDGNLFTSISGSTVGEIAKKLEDLIFQVESSANDGTSVINTRLSTLSGVTGNSMELFGSLFSANSTIKGLFIESEALHQAAINDRALIRSQFADADTGLQNAIDSEESARIAAVTQEATTRIANDNTINARIDATNLDLDNEETARVAADNSLDARLDIVEGGSHVSGSINKAQADAQAFAINAVANEALSRQSVDANLQFQIDAISSAFLYKGYIASDGRIVHIDILHANHNVPFENAVIFNGDFYKSNSDITITFNDSTTISLNAGDSILGIKDVAAGNSTASDFHKGDNTESADILREGMLDGSTIEKVSGEVRVKADSIDRSKLDDSVEADIDSKVEKAGDTMTGALKIDKTVLALSGYEGGYDYAAYVKQKSIGTSSLTDTQRALLVENEVYTDGSGNPLDLDYANATTSASHYKGSSSTMTVATVGTHSEGSVSNPAAAVYATGSYNVAASPHLGVNTGMTCVAQNAAISNLAGFFFTDTAGALNNRSAYLALAPDSLDLDAYRVARVGDPLPVQDAALVVDDYTGVSHAMYVNGKSEFVGKVIIPDSSADNEAVSMGEIKATEFAITVTISAGSSEVINHNLGTKKVMPAVWVNDELSTSGFDIERSENSITIYNDNDSPVTCEVLIKAFSI